MGQAAWDEIWKKKAGEITEDLSLESILKVNGYDVKYAQTDTETIRKYVRGLIEKLELNPGDHLLEVGSGAGAIAMPMIDEGIHVTGVDRSAELIEIADRAMPNDTFLVASAADFDLQKKDFDAVLSQGVFQFFESQDYGIESIRNMLAHARPGAVVAVTDLLDEANREALMKERVRLIGEKDFKERYVDLGLMHQFYDRAALAQGVKDHCSKVWFEEQFLENATAGYKFNLFARK